MSEFDHEHDLEPPARAGQPHAAPRRFERVGLIGKFQGASASVGSHSAAVAATARAALGEVALFLRDAGCAVTIEENTAAHTTLGGLFETAPMQRMGQLVDLCVVLGGDGTMLGAARELAASNTPVVGINLGRLGFVTDITLADYRAALGQILAGRFVRDERGLICARVLRGVGAAEQCIFEALAMNDVVVNRGGTAGMLEVRVSVNGQFVANQRADGLIIATATGSTAYTLSVGGPLLHPSVAAWVMAPIAPHTLSNRPIVLPDSCEVTLEVVGGRDVSANFDMQSLAQVMLGDRICVRRAACGVPFLHPPSWNYFATLRKKLGWNDDGGSAHAA